MELRNLSTENETQAHAKAGEKKSIKRNIFAHKDKARTHKHRKQKINDQKHLESPPKPETETDSFIYTTAIVPMISIISDIKFCFAQ